MAVNDQYRPGQTPFGMSAAIADTGAPGSPVPGPETSAGPPVATVNPVPVWGSSQQSWPGVEVTTGDTCSMSADAPVPSTGDPLTGLSLADVTQTGAGQGHSVMTASGAHQNSAARP